MHKYLVATGLKIDRHVFTVTCPFLCKWPLYLCAHNGNCVRVLVSRRCDNRHDLGRFRLQIRNQRTILAPILELESESFAVYFGLILVQSESFGIELESC